MTPMIIDNEITQRVDFQKTPGDAGRVLNMGRMTTFFTLIDPAQVQRQPS